MHHRIRPHKLDLNVPDSPLLDSNTAHFDSSTASLRSNTAYLESDTTHLLSLADLKESEKQPPNHWPAGFTKEEWEHLERIAQPVADVDYIDTRKRNEVILALCEQSALSLLELTWLLHRAKPYVRRLLKDMIDSGQLTYLYPDRPQHPHQRYSTRIS